MKYQCQRGEPTNPHYLVPGGLPGVRLELLLFVILHAVPQTHPAGREQTCNTAIVTVSSHTPAAYYWPASPSPSLSHPFHPISILFSYFFPFFPLPTLLPSLQSPLQYTYPPFLDLSHPSPALPSSPYHNTYRREASGWP